MTSELENPTRQGARDLAGGPHLILLGNGSLLDAADLESPELLAAWFREEHQYAERLSELPWDSQARRTLQRQAYSSIHQFSSAYDRRLGRPISFGFQQFHGRLLAIQCVTALRAKGRRADKTRVPSIRLLEIGVGGGELYPFLCAYFRERRGSGGAGESQLGAIECWGCDLVIDRASLWPPHAPQCTGDGECGVDLVELREGDLLDLEDHYEQLDQFDIVYWNDVIEHLPRVVADQYLNTIRLLLKPGGCLITCTPNRLTGPHDVSRFVIPTGQSARGLHLHEYSHRELRALLSGAGFRRFRSPVRAVPKKRASSRFVAELIKWIVEPLLVVLPARARKWFVVRYHFDVIVCQTPMH